MMSNEEVRGRAVWRRAIVPIAATAATVIGGMVIATPANAVTPTISVTAPSQLAADGLAVGSVVVNVNNQGGTANASSDLLVTMTGVPSDITCAVISLTPAASAPTGTTAGPTLNAVGGQPAGQCQWRVFTPAAVPPPPNAVFFNMTATNQALAYDLKVNGNVAASGPVAAHFATGTLSTTAKVYSVDASGNNTGNLAGPSAAVSTNLVAPAATIALTQKAAGSITNNGDTSETYVLAVTNPANTGLTGNANPGLSFTAPVGVTALSVSQDAGVTWAPATAGGTAGTFTFAPAAIIGLKPGTNVSKEYVVKVTAVDTTKATTGSLTVQATLTGPALVGGTPSATSGTVTTAVVGPTAPSFGPTPPAATVFQNYSYKVLASAGSGVTSYKAVGIQKSVDPVTGVVTYTQVTRTVGAPACGPTVIGLGDTGARQCDLVFNTATGLITGNAVDLGYAESAPQYTWTLIANNGEGGAATATPAPADNSSAAIAVHDVASTFALPILFQDVAVNSTFGPEIYKLANAGVIGGYSDGTFRGSLAVTRQAFIHYVAGILGTGTGNCDAPGQFPAVHGPSAFKDVAWNSPFCLEIQQLSTRGIVNGYADGTFRPGNLITRQAISAFVYRTDAAHRGVPATSMSDAACSTPTPFNDVDAGNIFCGDIEWMATNKITTGYPDGGFHPTGNTSREASAAFLARLETMWGV